MCGGFWQTSETHLEPGGVFDYGHALHHFKVEINTHTHTQTALTRRQDLVTATSYLPTLNVVPHGYTQTPHTLFRDMGPILTTAKLTWHWSDWSDPRKAKWTHERAGAFVFVECHTSSRGKPVTGPGRPLKLWEGCVGIASVATSDVNSNNQIAGYFLD